MAIPHAKPNQVIDIRPLGADLKNHETTTLVKTDCLEVIRLVLPEGKEIKPHRAPGEVLVQCLEGRVAFDAGGSQRELAAGTMIYLAGSEEHSVRACEDSSLLVTMQLQHKGK